MLSRKSTRSLVLATLLASLTGCAAQTTQERTPVLPLTTLRLYETGVGYFERSGTISSKTDTLPVPASHVDDALKTMIVMTPDGKASVNGVEFDSVMSQGLARSLAALPLEADTDVGYGAVLRSLRGVAVMLSLKEGSSTSNVEGTLLEVVKAPPLPVVAVDATGASKDAGTVDRADPANADTQDDFYLTVLSETGAVHRFRSSQLKSIKPVETALSDRLGAAASALSGRAAQIERRLRVLATDQTEVRIGYIAETPVWRASYRLIVEPKKDSARLQGWALLHNDTDEPWKNVKVELVNGQPDSFLFPLSAPRYSRRTLATPEERLSTVPQLANKTADQIWGDNIDDETGTAYGAGGLGLVGTGSGGGGRGYGSGFGRAGRSDGASDSIMLGNLAAIAQAKSLEAGALFQYTLNEPLALRAHGSTLVPFSSQDIKTRRISWFDGASARARSAVRIINTTQQTIPTGPIAIYEATGFAGETGVPRLKPTERAFLQFGLDLDMEIDDNDDPKLVDVNTKTIKAIEFKHNTLRVHHIRHRERHYTFRNRGGAARVVYLVLDVVKNATVTGSDEVDYDLLAKKALAVFKVDAQSKVARRLVTDEALVQRRAVSQLTSKELLKLSADPVLTAANRGVVTRVAGHIKKVEENAKERKRNELAVSRLNKDLTRMREHLKAMGGKSGGAGTGENPIVTRMLGLEDALLRARKEADTLKKQREEQLKLATEELKTLNGSTAAAPAPAPAPAPTPTP